MSKTIGRATKFEITKIISYATQFVNQTPELNPRNENPFEVAKKLIGEGYFKDLIIRRRLPGGKYEDIAITDLTIIIK